jgi:hypothetical protein
MSDFDRTVRVNRNTPRHTAWYDAFYRYVLGLSQYVVYRDWVPEARSA